MVNEHKFAYALSSLSFKTFFALIYVVRWGNVDGRQRIRCQANEGGFVCILLCVTNTITASRPLNVGFAEAANSKP